MKKGIMVIVIPKGVGVVFGAIIVVNLQLLVKQHLFNLSFVPGWRTLIENYL
jgi:hypothetical protein